jgi:hypothetical protein
MALEKPEVGELQMTLWVNIANIPMEHRVEVAHSVSANLTKLLPQKWDSAVSPDQRWWSFRLNMQWDGRVDTRELRAGASVTALSYILSAATEHEHVVVGDWPSYDTLFKFNVTGVWDDEMPKPTLVWSDDVG